MRLILPIFIILSSLITDKSYAQNTLAYYHQPKVLRPFVEYETVKYVLFNPRYTLADNKIKRTILENLPKSVIAIIYYNYETQIEKINELVKYIDPKKYIILKINSEGDSFWARDSLPYPVVLLDTATNKIKFGLVDSKYYHDFEPDQEIATFFKAPLIPNKHTLFEGGNLIADIDGTCFTTDKHGENRISAKNLSKLFGCKTLVTFHASYNSVGHIDERLKIISYKKALTDNNQYANVLKQLGYTVYILPTPNIPNASYLNSLLINGLVFMPTFNEPQKDELAKLIYEELGFKVITIDSEDLAFDAGGSIHCITMTYPDFNLIQ